eukprot:SAG11_NODE_3480_length_2422_cov_11.569522_3_plen_187_part_00
MPPPARAPLQPPSDAKNALLIVADDMRPDLPMYGNSIVHAPNLWGGSPREARRSIRPTSRSLIAVHHATLSCRDAGKRPVRDASQRDMTSLELIKKRRNKLIDLRVRLRARLCRPDTTQVWTFTTTWREAGQTAPQQQRVASFSDLPMWFKQHGWWTTNTYALTRQNRNAGVSARNLFGSLATMTP